MVKTNISLHVQYIIQEKKTKFIEQLMAHLNTNHYQ